VNLDMTLCQFAENGWSPELVPNWQSATVCIGFVALGLAFRVFSG